MTLEQGVTHDRHNDVQSKYQEKHGADLSRNLWTSMGSDDGEARRSGASTHKESCAFGSGNSGAFLWMANRCTSVIAKHSKRSMAIWKT